MGRGERAAVAVPAAAMALLLTAAIASHTTGDVRGDGPSHGTASALVGFEAAAFTALIVVGAVLFVYAGIRRAKAAASSIERRRRPKPWMVLPPLAAVLAIFGLIALLTRHHDAQLPPITPRARDVLLSAPTTRGRPVEPSEWSFVIGAAAGLIILVWLFRMARAAGAPTMTASPEGEREHASPMSLSDAELAAITDPRDAVLAAYGQLDALLAPLELRRRRSEGAREHIERIRMPLGDLAGNGRDLARLFERARYSAAPVSDEARVQALEALRALRALGEPVPV